MNKQPCVIVFASRCDQIIACMADWQLQFNKAELRLAKEYEARKHAFRANLAAHKKMLSAMAVIQRAALYIAYTDQPRMCCEASRSSPCRYRVPAARNCLWRV